MRTFIRLFGVAIFVFIFHLFCEYFKVYQTVTWFDAVLHFLGGVAMAVLALELERQIILRDPKSSIPVAIRFVSIVGFVAIIGVAWEWFEYGLDHYVFIVQELIGISQPTIGDTMSDLFFDLFGGSMVFFSALFISKRK